MTTLSLDSQNKQIIGININQNHIVELKTQFPNIIVITGMGMTMQSSQKLDVPMDMDWLVDRLLNKSNLTYKQNETCNEALDRWLLVTKPYKQREILKQILHTDLPVQNLSSWDKIIKLGRPIITQSLDLHAAMAMYYHLYGTAPKTLVDLNDVMLSWDSDMDDLKLFFEGKTKKILYREGSILHQNYLLGKRNYFKGSQSDGMKFINQMMKISPVLLIGTLAAVRTAPLQAKIRDAEQKNNQLTTNIYRVVKKGTRIVPFVNDILCENYQEDFVIVLNKICETLTS